MKKALLTALALSLPFAAFAFAKSRHPASEEDGTNSHGQLNCEFTDKAGKKTSFAIPLINYEDKDLAEGQDDGAAGHIAHQGYLVKYVTFAGTAHCPECRTGATRVFSATLTVSKGGKKEESTGGVFGHVEIAPKTFPAIKSISCDYQPPGSADDDKL